MAVRTSPGINTVPRAGATGGLNREVFTFTGTEVAIGDVVRIGKLPRFCRITNFTVVNSANTSSLTLKAGYEDVDGDTDHTDDDAFIEAGATGVATGNSRVHANGAPFIDLKRESYITLTTAGAVVPAANTLTALVEYTFLGAD